MLLKKLAPCTTSALFKANYASVASHQDHWPRAIDPNKPLTPYQILHTTSTEPYNKARFTELVKIYHPDRCDHPASHVCAHLPPNVRLERYRLIVAAHGILSNPDRRRAYDRFGVGWAGGRQAEPTNPFAQRTQQGEKSHPFSPNANATWEDWEYWRWQNEQRYKAGERNEPKYTSHTRFASGIFAFTIFAGFLQTSHIGNVTDQRRMAFNERSNEADEYFQKRQSDAKSRTRDGRIEEFMRQRDPAVLNDQAVACLVMDPDLCASFGVQGMDKELDMRKKFK